MLNLRKLLQISISQMTTWILRELQTSYTVINRNSGIPPSHTSYPQLSLSFPTTWHCISLQSCWCLELVQTVCQYNSTLDWCKKVIMGSNCQCGIPLAISASISWASSDCSGSSGSGPGGTVVVTPGAGVVVVVVVAGGCTSTIL